MAALYTWVSAQGVCVLLEVNRLGQAQSGLQRLDALQQFEGKNMACGFKPAMPLA